MSSPYITTSIDGVSFEDGPDQGRVLVFGHETGGRYSLMEYIVASGRASDSAAVDYGRHVHLSIEETFYIQAGELEFLIDAEVVTLKAGDFVRVPPGTAHGYANRTNDTVRLMVSFVPGGFEELFVKYRTDGGDPAGGAGFLAEATRDHASVFG